MPLSDDRLINPCGPCWSASTNPLLKGATMNDYPADQITFPRDSGTDILNNLDRRPTAIVDYWTENGRVEVIIRNEVN